MAALFQSSRFYLHRVSPGRARKQLSRETTLWSRSFRTMLLWSVSLCALSWYPLSEGLLSKGSRLRHPRGHVHTQAQAGGTGAYRGIPGDEELCDASRALVWAARDPSCRGLRSVPGLPESHVDESPLSFGGGLLRSLTAARFRESRSKRRCDRSIPHGKGVSIPSRPQGDAVIVSARHPVPPGPVAAITRGPCLEIESRPACYDPSASRNRRLSQRESIFGRSRFYRIDGSNRAFRAPSSVKSVHLAGCTPRRSARPRHPPSPGSFSMGRSTSPGSSPSTPRSTTTKRFAWRLGNASSSRHEACGSCSRWTVFTKHPLPP